MQCRWAMWCGGGQHCWLQVEEAMSQRVTVLLMFKRMREIT